MKVTRTTWFDAVQYDGTTDSAERIVETFGCAAHREVGGQGRLRWTHKVNGQESWLQDLSIGDWLVRPLGEVTLPTRVSAGEFTNLYQVVEPARAQK